MSEISAPRLEGWMTFPDVAERFQITRQSVYAWAERGLFHSLRCVGAAPVYLVAEDEVSRLGFHRRYSKTWLEAFEKLHRE